MLLDIARNIGRLGLQSEPLQTSAGVSFHVHRWGSGGTPCVLVHGFGLEGRTWLPFTLPYAAEFTFYAVDLPGHGRAFSSVPSGDQGFLDAYADCLETVIAGFGERPYALVGYSIGAFSCLRLLTRRRVRPPVRYLHLDHSPAPSPVAGWEGELNTDLFETFLILRRATIAEEVDLSLASFADLPNSIDGIYRRTIEQLTDQSLTNWWRRVISRVLHALPILGTKICHRVAWPWAWSVVDAYCTNAFDLREDLKPIQVPTLVVSGARNRVFPASSGAYLARTLPNARHLQFPGNHDVMFATPINFTILLGLFLRRGIDDVHVTT